MDREYKKTILEPNKIIDEKTGLDKYVLTWSQISEIIETEIEERNNKVVYKVEKLSEREKAILFDYDGMAEDNEVTRIVKKEGY